MGSSINSVSSRLGSNYIIEILVDPTVTPVDAPIGAVGIKNTAPAGIFQKADNGLSVNWVDLGTSVDVNAIHDNVAGEIDGIAEKVAPIGADLLLIEDSADANNKKKVQISNLPTTDADAIHDNVAGEINAIAEKVAPIGADLLLIEDSADANNKKKVQISNR